MRTGYSGLGDRWVATTLNQAAPKDAAGKPIPRRSSRTATSKPIINALLERVRCEGRPADGMVFARAPATSIRRALTCKGAKTDGCLSAQQTAALKKAFAGPKDSRRTRSIRASSGTPASPRAAGHSRPAEPGRVRSALRIRRRTSTWTRSVRAGSAIPRQVRRHQAAGRTSTRSSGRGGKLLFYHGVSDPWFSALDTVDYYEKMSAANGGDKTASGAGCSWCRGWDTARAAPHPGHVRSAVGGRRLGREGQGSRCGTGDRTRVPGTQPAALRVPGARSLQGRRRRRRRRQLRVPALIITTAENGNATKCQPPIHVSSLIRGCSRALTVKVRAEMLHGYGSG